MPSFVHASAPVLSFPPSVVQVSRPTLSFSITGNTAVDDEEIVNIFRRAGCAPFDSVCLKAACDSIARYYWSLGYIDVRVVCAEGDDGNPAGVDIVEGGLSPVYTLKIEGASERGRQIVEPVFLALIGEPLSPGGVESAIEMALNAYDRAGFPATRIMPEVYAAGEGKLGVVMRVEEGPRARIGSVEFQGEIRTRPDVLRRESGLRAGEPYDGSKVAEARNKLLGLGVFEQVSEAQLSMNPADSSLLVVFEAREARTSFVEGALAYAPSAVGNELYGRLSVDLKNIAGTLRKAGIYWMRRGGARSAWSLYYREPRIFALPLGIQGSVDADIDEDAYERRKFSLRLVQQGGRGLEARAGWFLATVREGPLIDDGASLDPQSSYKENGFDLGLAYDGTDRIGNPSRGATADLGLEVSALKCEDCLEPDRTIWSGLAGGSHLFGLRGNAVGFLAVRFRGVTAVNGVVPPSHLIRVGGMNSLRGYPEEWFITEKVLTATAELRYLAGRHSRLYLFVDVGTLEDEAHDFGDAGSLLAGYGFGLTTGSLIGVFRIEAASARGEPLSEAKLHLGLIQRF